MTPARSRPPVGVNCGWHGDKTEGGVHITACLSRAAVQSRAAAAVCTWVPLCFCWINSKYNSNKLLSTGALGLRMGGPAPPVPTAPEQSGSATKEVVPECPVHTAPPPRLNSVKQHINRQPVQMSAGTSRFNNDHHASRRLAVWSPRHAVLSHPCCCCCCDLPGCVIGRSRLLSIRTICAG